VHVFVATLGYSRRLHIRPSLRERQADWFAGMEGAFLRLGGGRLVMKAIDHETLVAHLYRLKLTAVRDQLDTLLDEAARSKMNLREALAFFVAREIARRDERRLSMASKIAQFPFVRELDGFDFEAQPSLDPGQIRELAVCRWIAHGDMVLLLGPPGTGKTHLAVALGREAIRQNYSVQFVTAATLVAMLAKAHQDGQLEKQLTLLARPKLPDSEWLAWRISTLNKKTRSNGGRPPFDPSERDTARARSSRNSSKSTMRLNRSSASPMAERSFRRSSTSKKPG
jgi:IstB-like ATP binding protein